MQYKPGDKVKHSWFDDVGIGVVTTVYGKQLTVEWQDNSVSVEKDDELIYKYENGLDKILNDII
jgi:hypothetical protein